MPASITEIGVFISCPSDVEKEKDIVIGVCDRLSRILRHKRISLKSIHWQKDVVPIITGEEPQKIIDRHLEVSDYDIYLGIFWRRFGDPLKNGLTPTESEFKDAFRRYQREKKPLISFFFKKEVLPPKDEYEVKQISGVQSFSDNLKNIGLYKPFVNELDFQGIAYETLHEFVLKLTETEDAEITCIRIKYPPVTSYLSRKVTPLTSFNSELEFFDLGEEKFDLIKLLDRENRIVLVGEAGVGKTIELKRVAYAFSQDKSKFFPVLINLNKYVDQKIENFLPDKWQKIPEKKLLLVLDGLDEIESKNKRNVIRRIEFFSEQHPASTIIISCRSNFYQSGADYSSGTLQDFKAFSLQPIKYSQIESYLKDNLITNTGDFLDKIHELQMFSLLQNPFYLFELVTLYNSEKKLPDNRADLFQSFIIRRSILDELRYRTTVDLANSQPIILKSLKTIALCAETLGRNYVTDDELGKIIPDVDVRELLKYCSLINKSDGDPTSWQFEHNSIQEYLSASILSQQSLDVIKSFISFAPEYIKIIPSWLNTVSFLFSLFPKETLIDWLIEVEPDIAVKFEPDKISDLLRIQIFQNIFNNYKKKKIWIDRDKYSYRELARFGKHPDNIDFLISAIDCCAHYTTVGNAVEILSQMQIPHDYREHLCNILIGIAVNDFRFFIPEHVQKDALMALSDLRYSSNEVIDTVMEKLKDSENDWVRYGLYYFLHNSDFLDDNIDIFLDGIKYVRFGLHNTNARRSRLMNERSELVNGLKKVSSKDSLVKLINYFISNDRDIHDLFMGNHDIRFLAINSAKIYKSHPDIFGLLLDFILKLYENYRNDEAKQFTQFFKLTKTQGIAFNKVLFRESRYKEQFLADLSDPDCIQYLLQEYEKDTISEKDVWSILNNLQWRNEKMFELLYKSLTDKYESKFIIEPPRNWDKMRSDRSQKDFDLLFDKIKFISGIKMIFEKENKIAFTKDELFDLEYKWPEQPYSRIVINTLRKITNDSNLTCDDAIKTVYQYDWDWFAISHIYEKLSSNKQLIVTTDQKEWIVNWCLSKERGVDFKTAIKMTDENSYSISWDAIYLWFFYREFEPEYSKSTLLDMLSFDHDREGINFLEKALPKRDIAERIVNNLKDGIVINDVLKNHLEYCLNNNIQEVLGFAFEQIKQESPDDEIRRISFSIILKFAEDLTNLLKSLNDIHDEFKWEIVNELINRNTKGIEDYLNNILSQSDNLEEKRKACEYLIKLQDVDALSFYVDWVKQQNKFDSQMYNSSNLSKLKTIEAVPCLIELLEITYQKTFQQPDDFDRLDRLILDAFKSIGLESENSFMIVKSAIEEFIHKNIDSYENVNWLYSFLSQLEQQYYVNKSLNITIDDVLEKLKQVNFNCTYSDLI